MYDRFKILVTETANRDLLDMFADSYERLRDNPKFARPKVVTK